MEYMYAAMLLHSAGKEITESSLEDILNAAGIATDTFRVKALVAALADVDIDETLKAPVLTTAPPVASPPVDEEKAEEKAEEEEKEEEEEDLQGLSALFG